jgi:hypothetical protein
MDRSASIQKILDKDTRPDLKWTIIIAFETAIIAIGTIFLVLITIFLNPQLQKIFLINFDWIIYPIITIALIFLFIVIWIKLADKVRKIISVNKKTALWMIIVVEFVIIIILTCGILGIFHSQPPPAPTFYPTEKMGDIGDISIERMSGYDWFIYTARGIGPHESRWKYRDDRSLNTEPAQFGGVMYLDPPDNGGEVPGSDLRSYRNSVTWEARSIDSECTVEFVMGGIQWKWDNGVISTNLPYPDSMPRTSLGTKTLTNDWQKFSCDLSYLPEKDFSNVIGGFGWIIPWGSNQIVMNESHTGSQNPRTFTIEIRNIHYN